MSAATEVGIAPDDDGAPQVGPRPAAPGSALASLRARRDAATATLWIDLEVPRYDPPVYVRYTPLALARIRQVERRHEKYKGPDRDLRTNAVLLGEACAGVWTRDADGEPVSIDPSDPHGPWPCFDARLAELLEEPASLGVVDVVRALYVTDGDLVATGAKVSDFSGYTADDLREAEQGN